MKNNKLKVISAKDLGRLALVDFCPRCFWIERNLGKVPGIFPSIFSSLDALTKRSVEESFKKEGKLPDWLEIKNIKKVEKDILFKFPFKESDWVLTGRPDNIFETGEGSYHIVDYKTAKFTDRQDELFPMYEIQLNSYALLAEKYGLEPVSDLSLIYCQPREKLDNYNKFKLSFDIHYLKVEKNLKKVEELLNKSREIVNRENPPLAREDCRGICHWLEKDYDLLPKNKV